MVGANALFAAVNKAGGVGGRKLVLKSLDDSFKPDISVTNAKKLIREDKVFALFFSRGTANLAAMLPVLEESKVPLVGSTSGAASLRKPVPRQVFHTRASTSAEVSRALNHLNTIGIKSVMVVYQDDQFGKEALAAAKEAIAQIGMTLVGTAPVERGTANVAQAADEVAKLQPKAVFMALQNKPVAELAKALRARGAASQLLGLSILGPQVVYKDAGDAARGIVLTQVTPSPRGVDSAMQRDYQRDMKATGQTAMTYNSFEGYIAARILVEGLRRSGTPLTRERFVEAMEGMRNAQIAGFKVDYSPDSHNGPSFVDITMLGRDGEVIR